MCFTFFSFIFNSFYGGKIDIPTINCTCITCTTCSVFTSVYTSETITKIKIMTFNPHILLSITFHCGPSLPPLTAHFVCRQLLSVFSCSTLVNTSSKCIYMESYSMWTLGWEVFFLTSFTQNNFFEIHPSSIM